MAAGAPVESDVSLPQRRKDVAQEFLHEDLSLPGGLVPLIGLIWPVNPKQMLRMRSYHDRCYLARR
jgi:hypothetical protein